jgi:hypothetical protein
VATVAGVATAAPRKPSRLAAEASSLGPAGLDGTGDQHLAGGAPAALAGPRAADVALVGLDAAGQGLAVRADHRLAELVQPGPGGLVAAEAHLPLQLGGGDPALAGGHQVDGEEPAGEAGLGLLEEGAGEQGVLLAAGRALVDAARPQRVGVTMAAALATEAVRPARPERVFPTLLVGPEPGVELQEILREIVGQHASLRHLVCIAMLTTE